MAKVVLRSGEWDRRIGAHWALSTKLSALPLPAYRGSVNAEPFRVFSAAEAASTTA